MTGIMTGISRAGLLSGFYRLGFLFRYRSCCFNNYRSFNAAARLQDADQDNIG